MQAYNQAKCSLMPMRRMHSTTNHGTEYRNPHMQTLAAELHLAQVLQLFGLGFKAAQLTEFPLQLGLRCCALLLQTLQHAPLGLNGLPASSWHTQGRACMRGEMHVSKLVLSCLALLLKALQRTLLCLWDPSCEATGLGLSCNEGRGRMQPAGSCVKFPLCLTQKQIL